MIPAGSGRRKINSMTEGITGIYRAFLVGVHRHCFKAGQAGEVTNVYYVKPVGLDWRMAYQVRFDDGVRDYVAVSDVEAGNYEWVSEEDARMGKLPEIKH